MRKFRHYLKNTLFEADVSRTKFSDYYERALKEIIAMGITPEQVEVLKKYGLLANDNVTGFYEGRSGDGRMQTILAVIQHVKQTNEQAFYVELDLVNLSGVNAALGHSGANEFFAQTAQAVRRGLTAVASEAAFFRHGGDEMSAVLVDTTERAIIGSIEQVRRKVTDLARQFKVHDIPHAKGKNGGGTGLHYGVARILPHHEQNPSLIFREADTKLEMNKRSHVHGNTISMLGSVAPAGQPGRTPPASREDA